MHTGFGPPVRRVPFSIRLYSYIVFAVSMTAILFMLNGTYGKKTAVPGVVRVSGFVQLTAPFSGTVARMHVAAGSAVSAGQPLLTVTHSPVDELDPETGGRMRKEQLEKLRDLLDAHRAEMERLVKNVSLLESHCQTALTAGQEAIGEATALVWVSEKRHALRQSGYQRMLRLEKEGAATRLELENAHGGLLEAEANLASARQSLGQLEQGQVRMQSDCFLQVESNSQNRLSLKTRINEIQERISDLGQQEDGTVLAQRAGRIDSLLLREGDVCQAGRPFAVLRLDEEDASPRFLLSVPADAIGQIALDGEVVIRIDSFPYETYGVLTGRVVHVPQQGVFEGSEGGGKIVYPVVLELLPGPQRGRVMLSALQDGMSGVAYLRQSPLSLMEWIFLPVKRAFIRNPSF